MSRTEAIQVLLVHREFFGEEVYDAITMAIDALETLERMEDDLK